MNFNPNQFNSVSVQALPKNTTPISDTRTNPLSIHSTTATCQTTGIVPRQTHNLEEPGANNLYSDTTTSTTECRQTEESVVPSGSIETLIVSTNVTLEESAECVNESTETNLNFGSTVQPLIQNIEQYLINKCEFYPHDIDRLNACFNQLTSTVKDKCSYQFDQYIKEIRRKCQQLQSEGDRMQVLRNELTEIDKKYPRSTDIFADLTALANPASNPERDKTATEMVQISYNIADLRKEIRTLLQSMKQLFV